MQTLHVEQFTVYNLDEVASSSLRGLPRPLEQPKKWSGRKIMLVKGKLSQAFDLDPQRQVKITLCSVRLARNKLKVIQESSADTSLTRIWEPT